MVSPSSPIERPVPTPAHTAVLERLAARWYAFPFRWQILIAISLLTMITGLVGGVLAVFDARARAAVETRSNVELWSHHIAAKTEELDGPADLAPFAERLAEQMAKVRHVSIHVLTLDGKPIVDAAAAGHGADAGRDDQERAPAWFVSLVQPTRDVRNIPIVAGGEPLGTVVIEGEPADEIAEAWELLVMMSLLWLGGTALMMVGLYFVLGFILDPLLTLAGGMRELEDGHYGLRLEPPKVRELAAIVENFNTLAEALDTANAENGRLYRQLIAVQEDERRQISRDLHDEFGPCLFGITAGTGAIERHARSLPEPQASAIRSCTHEIAQVSERLKSLNRALLNRLRPVALGRVTLAELIGELILSLERRHPELTFERRIEGLPASFGEDVDLTIYRCVQEGLTNALRHGNATTVTVAVSLEAQAAATLARVRVSDDGIGIPDTAALGYGLSGMRERVRALSGTLVIEQIKPAGTAIEATIPIRDPVKEKPVAAVLAAS